MKVWPGHITARDAERLDHFWVNPFGLHFRHTRVSGLILVNENGEVVEGNIQSTVPHLPVIDGIEPSTCRMVNVKAH